MNCSTLIRVLQQERQIQEQLLLAKRDEQRLLAVGDADGLASLVERMDALVKQAERLEANRMESVLETGQALGLMGEGVTLKALTNRLPECAERDELESLGESLRALAKEIQSINHLNARMLERSIETLHRELSSLAGEPEVNVYSQRGGKSLNNATRAGLNLKG